MFRILGWINKMKTLGYISKKDKQHRLRTFTVEYGPTELKYTRMDRLADAIREMEGLKDIDVYLIKGRKIRKIATREN